MIVRIRIDPNTPARAPNDEFNTVWTVIRAPARIPNPNRPSVVVEDNYHLLIMARSIT